MATNKPDIFDQATMWTNDQARLAIEMNGTNATSAIGGDAFSNMHIPTFDTQMMLHRRTNQFDMAPPNDSKAVLRYKTELCRSHNEFGKCKYGNKCQFAHGVEELHDIPRHPKYKTELCKPFHTSGTCSYGQRCHFIHKPNEMRKPLQEMLAGSECQPRPDFYEELRRLQEIQNRQNSPISPPYSSGFSGSDDVFSFQLDAHQPSMTERIFAPQSTNTDNISHQANAMRNCFASNFHEISPLSSSPESSSSSSCNQIFQTDRYNNGRKLNVNPLMLNQMSTTSREPPMTFNSGFNGPPRSALPLFSNRHDMDGSYMMNMGNQQNLGGYGNVSKIQTTQQHHQRQPPHTASCDNNQHVFTFDDLCPTTTTMQRRNENMLIQDYGNGVNELMETSRPCLLYKNEAMKIASQSTNSMSGCSPKSNTSDNTTNNNNSTAGAIGTLYGLTNTISQMSVSTTATNHSNQSSPITSSTNSANSSTLNLPQTPPNCMETSTGMFSNQEQSSSTNSSSILYSTLLDNNSDAALSVIGNLKL